MFNANRMKGGRGTTGAGVYKLYRYHYFINSFL